MADLITAWISLQLEQKAGYLSLAALFHEPAHMCLLFGSTRSKTFGLQLKHLRLPRMQTYSSQAHISYTYPFLVYFIVPIVKPLSATHSQRISDEGLPGDPAIINQLMGSSKLAPIP